MGFRDSSSVCCWLLFRKSEINANPDAIMKRMILLFYHTVEDQLNVTQPTCVVFARATARGEEHHGQTQETIQRLYFDGVFSS